MFKSTSLTKKKTPEKVDLYQEGLSLIRGKLYKQATKTFLLAIQEDNQKVPAKLSAEFNQSIQNGQFEAAVAIGEALSEIMKLKAEFLVELGNCYRRLSNYQKANDLYRNALRIDKTDKSALFNLAASLAKVEKYNREIDKSLEKFKDQNNFVLPSYLNNPDIIEKLEKELEREREERIAHTETLIAEKEQLQKSGNTEQVKEIIKKIETEERQLATPQFQAVSKKLKRAIKTNWAGQTIEESKINLQKNLYNLGLYALSQKNLEQARDSFAKLNSENCSLEHLDLLTAITQFLSGFYNKAIEQLVSILKNNPNHRLATVNLGIMYKKRGNQLLAIRYLLKAADLLEKSGGLYCLNDIKTRANEYFENDEFETAFSLFQIVINESPTAEIWNRIGEIHISRDELIEATMAFHESLELDPENTAAQQKLIHIHDIYTIKADTKFRNGLNLEAITLYQNALEIHTSIEVMQKAIRAYEKVDDFTQVSFLKNEIERLKQKEKEDKQEKRRHSLIKQGRFYMKQKKFDKAIERLEKAFDMKPERDTFLLLAHIFKALNHSRKLSNLVKQWRTLMERKVK